ncbi:hypothetical protein L1787_16585 [Acuticoccus sp. M5D2P5]|uniref:hypothetical protein n=1 Tax=Acuticoccus kalidii TaxID=2910977 RepID=UPI001F2DCDFB|nr:hypothetical protein [Acuticoccus kalidii]MCF3935023.1 hypothetical protein [Acuticoccus kalidii]
MPIAIVFREDGSIPAIYSEKTDALLAARLGELPGAPEKADAKTLRAWLYTLPEPSGWFASVDEARSLLARSRQEPAMQKDELRHIRETLGMTRAEFADALGFKGNDNTRHKQVFEMESGSKPIMPERARRARSLLAEHWVSEGAER